MCGECVSNVCRMCVFVCVCMGVGVCVCVCMDKLEKYVVISSILNFVYFHLNSTDLEEFSF